MEERVFELVRICRQDLGVPRRLLARLIGVSERTLCAWEKREHRPLRASWARLHRFAHWMEDLLPVLREVLGPERAAKWLETPLPAFDGKSPVELCEHGQSDRLSQVAYLLGSGQPL